MKHIDYDLIKNNPKILCGFSDITTLSNSIYKKTELVTYSGLHYSTFGMKMGIEYTIEYFKKYLFSEEPFDINYSNQWSDDPWFLDQENRKFYVNNGYKVINEGNASGQIVGGNLCTLNLLQGTEFMPDLTDKILFIEDTEASFPEEFDRDLQSLIHQPNFEKIKGIVLGRFQIKSKIGEEKLLKIIKSKRELKNIPIVSNLDFGHTTPHITFPISGHIEFFAEEEVKIRVKKH